MGKRNKQNRQRKGAALVAILIVVAMVLSLIAPIFSARAMAAEAVMVTEETVQTDPEQFEELVEENHIATQEEFGQETFSLDMEIGFDQQYIVEGTAPITGILQNKGDEDFQGELQLKVYTDREVNELGSREVYNIYYVPVELPKGGIQQINMQAVLPWLDDLHEVSLVDTKGNTVFRKYIPSYPLDGATILVGVLSERPADLSYLEGLHFAEEEDFTSSYTKTAFFNGVTFPSNGEILQNFKVIVIDDFDTKTLTEEQQKALENWVKAGGLLMLGTGIHGQKTMGGLETMLPITVSNRTETKTITTLTGYPLSLALAEVSGEGIHTLLEENGIPYVSEGEVGEGKVLLFHFALSLSPIPEAAGITAMLQTICETSMPSLAAIAYQDSYQAHTLAYSAKKFPELKTNSIYMIFIVIVVYIVLIGPVFYIVLKKKDKREWAWLLIPVTSFICLLLVFGLSRSSQYKSGIVNIVSQTELEQGASVGNTSLVGYVKTSEKGDIVLRSDGFFNLQVGEEYYGRSIGQETGSYCDAKILGTGNTEITYFDRGSWADNSFTASTVTDLGGSLDGTVKIIGDTYEITVENNTNRDFTEVLLQIGDEVFLLESIPAGEITAVTKPIGENDQIGSYGGGVYDALDKAFDGLMYNRQTIKQNIARGDMTRQDVYRKLREMNILTDVTESNAVLQWNSATGMAEVEVYAFEEGSILPTALSINGKTALEQNLNLYHTTFSLELPEGETFTLPYGVIQPILLEEDTSNIQNYGDGTIYGMIETEVIWNFPLPYSATWQEFTINVPVDSGNFYEPAEIYNAATDSWEVLQEDAYSNPYAYGKDGVVSVKYFVREQTEVRQPELALKGVGGHAGN